MFLAPRHVRQISAFVKEILWQWKRMKRNIVAIKPNCVSASSLFSQFTRQGLWNWYRMKLLLWCLLWTRIDFKILDISFWGDDILIKRFIISSQHLSANTPILINISTVMFNISVNTRKVHFGWIQQSAAVLPNIKCWQFGFNSNPAPCNEDLGSTQY